MPSLSSSALRDAAVASVLSSIRTDGAASRRSQLASTRGGSRRDPCRPRAGVQAHAAAQQRRAVAAAAHAGVLQRGVVGAVASVDDLGVWLDHQVGQRAVRRERLDRVAAFQRRGPDARCIAGGTQVAADPVVITAELDPGIRIGAQPAGFFGMVGAIQAAGVAGRPAARPGADRAIGTDQRGHGVGAGFAVAGHQADADRAVMAACACSRSPPICIT